MNQLTRGFVIALIGVAFTGCVALASGAELVKITKNSADVASCTAVGNVNGTGAQSSVDYEHIMQNQAIGLNADVVFDTGAGGVAYRCNKK